MRGTYRTGRENCATVKCEGPGGPTRRGLWGEVSLVFGSFAVWDGAAEEGEAGYVAAGRFKKGLAAGWTAAFAAGGGVVLADAAQAGF